MMKYRLIATDLDDTLLDKGCLISARTKEALRLAQDQGVYVTIATGRMYQSALIYAEELGLDLPLITYQGALVKTSVSKEVIYHRTIPLDLARKVIEHGVASGLTVNLYLDDQLYVSQLTTAAQHYSQVIRVSAQAVGDLQSFMTAEPTKLLFIGDEKALDLLWQREREIFGEQLYITKSKPNFLEFTHPQATKGFGLATVAQHLGVDRSEIIAFGDSFNDLDLLRGAGFAVAMGNARDELKKEADYVTASNNDHGVAEAIEKFVLA